MNHPVKQTLHSGIGLLLFLGLLLPVSASAEPDVASSDAALDDATLLGATEAWAQVPSVSELSDVQPSDWAYQALQSLSDRYGIPLGYPDGTFRGDQPLTRYEFAAALTQALSAIEGRVQRGQIVTNEADLRLVRRLMTEFSSGIAPLGERMGDLETRTDRLEVQQFSPTAKLYGEAIFDLNGQLINDDSDSAVFQNRLQLDIAASFTGSDVLQTRLFSAGAPARGAEVVGASGALGSTAEGQLVTSARGDTDGDIVLDRLSYTTSLGDRVEMVVAATGGQHSHYVHSTNALFGSQTRSGALSTFAQASPIYRIGGGAGVGFDVDFAGGLVALSGGYLAESATDPRDGLFDQDYAALGQLTLTPSDRLGIGVTYVRGYHTDDNAIFDSGLPGELLVGTFPANAAHAVLDTVATTNSYGFQTSYAVNRRLTLNAFGGYTDLQLTGSRSGEIWYYGLGAEIINVVLPQSLVGVLIGVEPYLGSLEDFDVENDTSLHLEAFYRLQLSDAIALTPGLVWITAPNQNRDNDDAIIATFRTTFRF